jgi:hypothetical protein
MRHASKIAEGLEEEYAFQYYCRWRFWGFALDEVFGMGGDRIRRAKIKEVHERIP